MPLSDNENRGTETWPWKGSGKSGCRSLVVFLTHSFMFLTNGEIFFAVFNGSVLWPHEVLNNQQGASVSDSFPAAEHCGAASERLGATQSSLRQWTKDNQPNSSGCSKSQSLVQNVIVLSSCRTAWSPLIGRCPNILTVCCRIWAFLFHLRPMRWEMTSSWKTPPSFQEGSSLMLILLVGSLTCLDRCLVRYWWPSSPFETEAITNLDWLKAKCPSLPSPPLQGSVSVQVQESFRTTTLLPWGAIAQTLTTTTSQMATVYISLSLKVEISLS